MILAWVLLFTAEKDRDPALAPRLTDRLIKADPGNRAHRATRALALARLGRDADAVAAMAPGEILTPFESLTLAPSYRRLGQPELAKQCLDRAIAWRASPVRFPDRHARDIDALIAEARAALSRPPAVTPASPR